MSRRAQPGVTLGRLLQQPARNDSLCRAPQRGGGAFRFPRRALALGLAALIATVLLATKPRRHDAPAGGVRATAPAPMQFGANPTPRTHPAPATAAASVVHESPTSDAIAQLAATHLREAQALVVAERDPATRGELVRALLRAWGRLDAGAAAAWAKEQALLPPLDAIAEVLQGAAERPTIATDLAAQLARDDSEHARDYGRALIFALDEHGAAGFAAEYVRANATLFGPGAIEEAYHGWARRSPEEALISALRIADAPQRTAAVEATLSTWALTDPQALAEHAITFPQGHEQSAALTEALHAWLLRDPATAGDWIATHRAALSAAESALAAD